MKKSQNKDKVVFFDIDGTLIDLDQQPTVSTLPGKIKLMQKQDFQFGLNSNRAREDVETTIKLFSLNGPFILENGAYYADADENEHIFVSRPKEHLGAALQKILSEYFGSRATVKRTDTTSLYTRKTAVPGTHIYINHHRKFTGSIHHRIDGISNMNMAIEIAEHLNTNFKQCSFGYIAAAHQHGHSVTVELPGVTKATGLHEYKKRHPNILTYAVGDGMGDMVLAKEVDYFCAVTNAIPALKDVADYVSPYPITEGVADILNHIHCTYI